MWCACPSCFSIALLHIIGESLRSSTHSHLRHKAQFIRVRVSARSFAMS
jgi:hypothetical protein